MYVSSAVRRFVSCQLFAFSLFSVCLSVCLDLCTSVCVCLSSVYGLSLPVLSYDDCLEEEKEGNQSCCLLCCVIVHVVNTRV